MTKIAIKSDPNGFDCFDGDEYVIDLDRKFEGYYRGDLICTVSPFSRIPLTLEIAIRNNGPLIFREWRFEKTVNPYLHTREKASKKNMFDIIFIPTQMQVDAVNGLFSGRIKFEGLRLSPGGTLQAICPIDVKYEEFLNKQRIYLA